MIGRLGPGQRTGFHIDLRVAADASPGNLPNIADLTPSETPGLLAQPGAATGRAGERGGRDRRGPAHHEGEGPREDSPGDPGCTPP